MSPLDRDYIRSLIVEKITERRRTIGIWSLATLSLLFLFGAFYTLCVKPPADFPVRTIVTVREKAGLNQIAGELHSLGIIRSEFWFRVAVILTAGDGGVLAGDYLFVRPMGVFGVASRVTKGNFGLIPVKITFPEGTTAERMAVILQDQIVDFDGEMFLRLAKESEGYLFPDTYFFPPNAKPQDVLNTVRSNFDIKVKSLDGDIQSFKKPLKDIVIMASILEAEARTTDTRKTIAGILWKRLELGMPLQVDAPFQYIIGKNTFQLTTADLKYDSPYNTYKYKGLPPGAIGNPGLDSLLAAVTPAKSPYFYYLSDIRGNMHYAVTHDEHVLNKEKYLR